MLIILLFTLIKVNAQFNTIRVLDSTELKIDLDFIDENYAYFTFKMYNRYETLLVEHKDLKDTIFFKESDVFLNLGTDVYLQEDTVNYKDLIEIQFMYKNPFMNRERTWLNAFYVVNGDTIENDLVYSDITHNTYVQRPDTNRLNIQIYSGPEHLIREIDVNISKNTNKVKIDIFDLFSELFFNEHHYKELFPITIGKGDRKVVLFLIDSDN